MIPSAIVSWSNDGTVTDVTVCDNIDSQEGVEFCNGILVPDLVDAHCHLELSHMKGLIPEGGGFVEFARSMGKCRGGMELSLREEAAKAADAALWRQGVGAVGDVCNGSSTFGIKAGSGINYLNFIELFGINASSAAALVGVVEASRSRGLRGTVAPHSTYSLNDAAFRSAVEGGSPDMPLSVHFMESPAEKELFRDEGELYSWYRERGMAADFTRYGSPAGRIVACVPPERDILLIHNCCVTEEDIDVIEGHFTGRVTWVLCPRSNHYISRISPPVGLLRRKGVKIAVGTDSLASNTSLDMVAELRALGDVPLEELLEWSTANGAEALGAKALSGGFEVGSKCGAVLISGVEWGNMRLTEDSVSERIF